MPSVPLRWGIRSYPTLNVDLFAIDGEPIYVVCPACGEEALVVERDEGFGYSFGAINGYHQDSCGETKCCNVRVD